MASLLSRIGTVCRARDSMLTRSSVDLPPPHRPGRYPAREQRLGAVRLANPRVHHDAQRLICHLRYLLEHGLKADGRPDPDAKDLNEGGSFETFFTETGNGNTFLAPSSSTWTPLYVASYT